MPSVRYISLVLCALAATSLGCRSMPAPSPKPSSVSLPPEVAQVSPPSSPIVPVAYNEPTEASALNELKLVQPEQIFPHAGEPLPAHEQSAEQQTDIPAALPAATLDLPSLVASVRSHFPLIQQAVASRRIASGEALSARGSFDRKLQAYSDNQPLDFYENYRHGVSVKRDTTWGGQTFAGYRVGRGAFESWYLERETNKGGEFKAGFMAPIIRDRSIDANRAALWQAQLERRRVEPEIIALVIRYVRDGSIAYWNWVAAGANRSIMQQQLELALERNKALIGQVEAEEKARISLTDNQRIIVSRESKLIDANRKLQQAAIKLSLFLRSEVGEPLLPDESLLPHHSVLNWLDSSEQPGLMIDDTQQALLQRPELGELQLVRQQLQIALRQACNETQPNVDAGLLIAQDVGEPTSSKRDKSEFEIEARITLEVPLERRKAYGKVRSLRGKLAKITAKTRFTSDKIVAEVQIASAGISAASQRVGKARENLDLATKMREAEQILFDAGQSTLFQLNAREKQAAEAAEMLVDSAREYHIARAAYAAALGFDSPLIVNPEQAPTVTKSLTIEQAIP